MKGAVCDGKLVCPWHKAAFAIANGQWREPLALQNLRQYPVTLEQNRVLVNPRPRSPASHSQIRGEYPQTAVAQQQGRLAVLKAVLSCEEYSETAGLLLKMQQPVSMRAASEMLA